MKELINEIKLYGLGLELGESLPLSICPFCEGGRTKENSFSVTRINKGLLYNCFRAKCGVSGMVRSGPPDREDYVPKEWVSRPFKQPLSKLPDPVYEWLKFKYELPRELLDFNSVKYAPKSNRLYMPIYDIEGMDVGGVAKSLPEELSEHAKGSIPEGPKSLNYWREKRPKLHFPFTTLTHSVVVAVEDHLSAMKVGQFLPSVALMGTSLNAEAAVLLKQCYDHLILMLDPDALKASIKIADDYRSMFKTVDVINMKADPKDTKNTHLRELISRHMHRA